VGVGVSDVGDRGRLGQVDRLEIAPEMNGLGRGHHVDVAGVGDRPLTDRDVEHLEVLVLEARRADDRALLV